jgi:hypothetical protein
MDVHIDVKEARQDTSIIAELIVSLRTTTVSDDWKLDKQQSSQQDLLDSLRLSLCNYEIPKCNP